MGRKIFEAQKYGMVICPNCNGRGYIWNVNAVQNAGALGSLEMKRKKTQLLPLLVINREGRLQDPIIVQKLLQSRSDGEASVDSHSP